MDRWESRAWLRAPSMIKSIFVTPSVVDEENLSDGKSWCHDGENLWGNLTRDQEIIWGKSDGRSSGKSFCFLQDDPPCRISHFFRVRSIIHYTLLISDQIALLRSNYIVKNVSISRLSNIKSNCIVDKKNVSIYNLSHHICLLSGQISLAEHLWPVLYNLAPQTTP